MRINLLVATLATMAVAVNPAAGAFIEMAGINGSVLTTYTTGSGVIYSLGDAQGTGSGVFPAFLRMETDNKSDSLAGFEDGFNTDGDLKNDEKPGAHTHSFLFSNLGTVDVGGTLYYELRLDWNEPNNGVDNDQDLKFLEMQIYSSLTGNQENAAPEGGLLNTLLYTMSADLAGFEGFHVFDTNAGQGQDDFQILIPVSLLNPGAGENYFTLYAKFGAAEDTPGSAEPAFEEFSYRACPEDATDCTPPPPQPEIPEPGTYALMGAGLLALGILRKRVAK